jgi:hypothetical protein
LVLVVVAALVAVALAWSLRPDPLEKVYGRDGLRTLHDATQVVAYRVSGNRIRDAIETYASTTRPATTEPAATRPKLFEYDIRSAPVRLSAEQQARLLSILGDASTYGRGRVSACIFNADVAYEFSGARGHRTTVVLCFHCADMHVHEDDGAEYKLDSFAARRAELLDLSREVFSSDRYLREIR